MRLGVFLLIAPAFVWAQELPKPVLIFNGTVRSGSHFTQYNFAVSNYSAYSEELFKPAPDLPPCGVNQNASRMWVDIYNDDQQRLYGFCAMKAPADLQKLWFAVPDGKQAPGWIRVVLNDRRTGQTAEGRLKIPKQ